MTVITECSICRQYRDRKDLHKWYYPTVEMRKELYYQGIKISHGYCLPCAIEKAERLDGLTPEEVSEMVAAVNKSLEDKLHSEDKK